MEVAEAHGNEIHVFVAEMFGTCFLVYAVNMQAAFTDGFGVFGIAMTLLGMIFLWGGISGGNFNPAVTLGVLISRPRDIGRNIPLYIVSTTAQFVGGCIGMMLAYVSLWQMKISVEDREKINAILEPTTSIEAAYLCEAFCTFLFISVILMIKNPVTAPTKNGYWCCWSVGIALLTNIVLCAGHTGAALNPVVGFIQTCFASWQLESDHYWQYLWVYVLGPYTGGIMAAFFHYYHVYSIQAVVNKKEESGKCEWEKIQYAHVIESSLCN